MTKHIFLESLKIRKKESLLLIIQGVLLFLLIIAITNISYEGARELKQLNRTTAPIRKITDNYILEEEHKFFSRPENVLLLKKFYKWENSNSMWRYIIANRQNVGIVDKKLDKVFEVGYEVRQRTEGDYKSLQVNDEFFEYFSLKITEGRKLLADDYVYKNCLAVVLGNKYKGIFNLNEKFNLYYLGLNLNCEVVGFLAQNSYFNNGYDLESLDYCIILPSIEEVRTADFSEEEIKAFELKLYLDKCSGYIASDENSNFLQTQISRECYKLDILPYSLEGMSNYYPTMWGLEGKQLWQVLTCFAILIVINAILCISLNMITKIDMLKRIYGIYILNGTSKNEIISAVLSEIAFAIFVSEVLAAIISYCYWGKISISILILLYFIICFLSSIYPLYMLAKIDLSLIIKEQENI